MFPFVLTQSIQEIGLVLARRGERQSAAAGGATGGSAEEQGALAPFLVRVLRRVRAQLDEPGAPPPSLTVQNCVQVRAP
jgi:hypothetical protein